ncbi:DUF3772 domain-containing protein [Amorphus sp. 3PC139-8]|uniref:DUF3772 domain-containing protein n=1 Tax=Amorphus sp. 3PC139-8 TaxID=2735676 RepID=UPI00345CE61A
MRWFWRSLCCSLLIVAILVPAIAGAVAQDAQPPEDNPDAPSGTTPLEAAPSEPVIPATVDPADQGQLDAWRARLDRISERLVNTDLSDEEMIDLRRSVSEIHNQIQPMIERLQPRADALRARLQELSLPKEQSALEPEALKRERETQTRNLVALEAVLKQAHATALRADEVVTTIEDKRRRLFAQEIGERRRSILDPGLWRDFISEIPEVMRRVRSLINDWRGVVSLRSEWSTWGSLLAIAGLAYLLFGPVRRHIYRRISRDPSATNVPSLTKASRAVAIASLNVGLVAAVMMALIGTLDAFNLLPHRIEKSLVSLLIALGLFASIRGLAVAIVAPNRPGWRYLSVADSGAGTIMRWVILSGGIYSLGLFFARMANVMALPLPTIEGIQGVFALATAAAWMGSLRAIARGLNEDSDSPDGGSIAIWRWVLPPAWLAAIVAGFAPLAGYLTLGWFMIGQMVWTGLVLSILYLILILADEVMTATFRGGTTVGDILLRDLRFRPATVEQTGVLLSGLGRLLLIAFAFVTLLAPFGFTGDDLFTALRRSVTNVSIGSVTLSPAAFLGALIVFAIGMLATRAFQRWLDTRFLPHTRMDVGLKTSVRTGLGYLGVITAGVVAFSVAGFNLQNVALIAGALSVGVGFGLQSIVNNFVSGLILLAERPIKVGDWIVVGAEQGYVKRINVRSTEIETFDRSSVIVPNSDLISGVVKNWMHTDTTGRVIIDVRVPFDADPDKVHDLLLEVAQDHPNVLAYPEAKVYLSNFGESALEFQIFCYLGNVDYVLSARSELRFAVYRTLKANGIEIPYTRRDLHMVDLDTLERFANAGANRPSRPRKRASGKGTTSGPAEPLEVPDADGGGDGGDA